MQFSAMTMNMFYSDIDEPADDHRIIGMAVEQSIWLAGLGYNPWYTDHHFRGAWHSNPMQLASYVVPQIPRDRYVGFGVLSIPFYHPLRLVESMNLLDHFTEGRVLYGVGSGWQGAEVAGLGVDPEYHASGQAAEETLDIMERLWAFRKGDPDYHFRSGSYSGRIHKRVMPAPYSKPHPTIIRTASREAGLVRAAHKGWPAFLGIFGNDLRQQAALYRRELLAANHPPEVVENCLRWCSFDWMAVCVADTDEEATARADLAKAEQMHFRSSYIERHGKIDGPVMKAVAGQSTAEAYAKGDDMKGIISGSPETVARKVQKLADMGINHLHLRFMGEWAGKTRHICEASAELFAREVMPRFTGLSPLREVAMAEA